MQKPTFKVTYLDKNGEVIGHRSATCWSHWDACNFGWAHMPPKGEDFQVEELTFGAQPDGDPRPERKTRHKGNLPTTEDEDAIVAKAFEILRSRAGLPHAI